ncbi:translocation/assembly module TamB [Pasteurella canis]|uniref:autotransporter assembly complex protein TamB n=1 Tax=Pasteurella canis TaxID=753 RepID=UPI001E5F9268|nr:translocation/assembly module TamB domain-containing protein [Pasteurella canis]UEA16300.1 translocation/assembly module TamB [Pasteurella canis]
MTEQTKKDEIDTATTTDRSKVKTSKPLWRRLLCTISAVIVLLIFILGTLLVTSTGQRWLIQLADRSLDDLSIEKIEGGLQEGLTLNNLFYESTGVKTHLSQARLELDLACLWHLQICLRDISLYKPHIQINTALLPATENKKDNVSKPMRRIDLPVSIQVDNLLINKLRLVIDDNSIDLAHFQTSASLTNESGFILEPTTIDELLVKVSAQAEKEKTPTTYQEKQPIDWTELEQKLAQPLLAKLEQVDLPFDIKIKAIQGQNWQYQYFNNSHQQQIDIPLVLLQAEAIDHLVKLHQLHIQSSLADVQGHAEIQLNENFPIELRVKSHIHELMQDNNTLLPESQLNLALTGSLKKQTALSLEMTGALNANVNGVIALNQAKTPFELKLIAQDFRYPFNTAESNPLQVPQLNLDVSGDLLNYQLQLNTSVQGMNLPKTDLHLQAKGELQSVEIEQLHLDTLKGSADMQGKIGWRDGVQWYSDLKLSHLNLSDYVADLPTILSGGIFSTGIITDQVLLFDIPELDLQGSLSNRQLVMKGILSFGVDTNFHNPSLKAPALLLSYGNNNINVAGFIGKESELEVDIDAPDLRGLVPNLSASLQGKVNLTGHIAQPIIDADIIGNQIKFNEFNLNKILLKGQVDLANQSQGQLDLQLDNLNYGDVKLNNAKLALQGNEHAHQLNLSSQGTPVAPNLNIEGSFDRKTQIWQGTLSQVAIQSLAGPWNINQNVPLSYAHETAQMQINAHCWQNPNIELCFPQNFRVGKTGEIPFQLKKFDLALINKLIQQELLTGQLQSQGNVAWFTDKPVELTVQLSGDNLHLAQKIDYRTFKLAMPKLTVNADLQNNNLTVKSNLLLQEQGNISTNLEIKDLAKTRQLGGTFTIHKLNLSLINQLLSNNEKLHGDITADLKFGGSLSAPSLNGVFSINNLTAKMKSLPFDINGGELALNFQGNRSTLRGHLQTPDSRLNLDGEASWQNLENWNSRLHAQAEQFKVDIPSIAKLKISPNIEIKASPKRLELSGNIDIPWARIEIESLPETAVSVSADEVILDGKPKTKMKANLPAKTKSGMEILSDLKINIGRDVYLNAYGLKTNLHGLLSVKQEKGNLGLFGQVYLSNGRYASFGQDLLIRKGMISFSGQPSQPMLNIEAIRNPESMDTSGIIAGIKVLGLAENPEIKVFSEPGMSQDQALSYVLTGRSLENSGEAGSGGSIGAALLGLGLAKSGKAVGGLGQAFGIQDLNLGTQGVGDSSKVVVSGNITPRLQVKYGVGLFDGLAEFTVRYRLLPKLYLQSVSGVTQAVDLLYQFEF